jgi:uncharacterized membrane protein YoaK (UPF0700 family)
MASPKNEREQIWICFALAAIAGSVDAIGYLGLSYLFTSHMSGNSAALGAFGGMGDWSEAARRAFPIPLFILGALIGALVIETAIRRKSSVPFIGAFGLEAVLLLTCVLFGRICPHPIVQSANYDLFTALLALAMGVQSANLRRVMGAAVRTTFITGLLASLAAWLLWLRARTRGRGLRRRLLALRVSTRLKGIHMMGLYGGIWLCFIAGAVAGSIVQSHWNWNALLLPLVGLFAVTTATLWHPFGAVSRIREKGNK